MKVDIVGYCHIFKDNIKQNVKDILEGKATVEEAQKYLSEMDEDSHQGIFSDENFTSDEIEDIKSTTFRDIIMRNTDIKIMQENVFEAIIPEEINDGPELEAIARGADTDWIDLVVDNGYKQNHQIGIRGGNSKTGFAISCRNVLGQKSLIVLHH